MFNRKIKYGIVGFLLALFLVLGNVIWHPQGNDNLEVIFIDVGQGDAILISQGSYQMLIDGGKDGKVLLNKLGKYIPFWDRDIEVMLATHPDQDHIAGLIDVLEAYNVKSVIETGDQSQSQTYKKLQEEISNEKSEKTEAKKGTEIKFPSEATAKIVYPFFETGDINDSNSNSGSVVVKIDYGENSFLLTGDLPKEQEEMIISSGQDINSKILKVAHHGSKYSTGAEFLDKVSPKQTVISVGKGNSYGHPNSEVIDLLKNKNIDILRTDERGDIIYGCKKDLDCEIQ